MNHKWFSDFIMFKSMILFYLYFYVWFWIWSEFVAEIPIFVPQGTGDGWLGPFDVVGE